MLVEIVKDIDEYLLIFIESMWERRKGILEK